MAAVFCTSKSPSPLRDQRTHLCHKEFPQTPEADRPSGSQTKCPQRRFAKEPLRQDVSAVSDWLQLQRQLPAFREFHMPVCRCLFVLLCGRASSLPVCRRRLRDARRRTAHVTLRSVLSQLMVRAGARSPPCLCYGPTKWISRFVMFAGC